MIQSKGYTMKANIKLLVGLFILATFHDASAMLCRTLFRSPQKRFVVTNARKRNCHQNSENNNEAAANARAEIIQDLQNVNRGIAVTTGKCEQALAILLKQIEISRHAMKLNEKSIESLKEPEGPYTVYDTQALLQQFNELGKKLTPTNQLFQ